MPDPDPKSGTAPAILPNESSPELAPIPRRAATGGSGRKGKSATGGSLLDIRYGRQAMKAYPLTEEQIENLAGLGLLATLCFSGAAGVFGFAIDLDKDLSIAVGVPAEKMAWWSAVSSGSFLLSGALVLIGLFLLYRGHSKYAKIKANTEFPDES